MLLGMAGAAASVEREGWGEERTGVRMGSRVGRLRAFLLRQPMYHQQTV